MRTDLRGGAWIHVQDPDEEEQAWLRDEAGIPVDWIGDALDPYQRPRFQRSDDLVLLIVLCSRTARTRPEPFATVPLGIVLLQDRAVTICRRDPDLIDDARGSGEDGARSPSGIALEILAANEEIFRRDLREIHDHSTFEEEELRASLTGGRLGNLIDQGRSLAYFDSALRSNGRVLEAARGDGLFEGDGGLRAALEEVRERNDENSELAEVFSRIHGDLMEGFSSLVSMNLNALVRTLTEITIALAVPAIIVGLWGMNVPTPFAGSRIGFAVLTVFVVALTVVTFLAIRYAERIGPRPGRRS